MAERDIKADILLAVGSLPDVRLWNQPVGRFRAIRGDYVLHVGIEGMADLSGILRCCGRRLEIECKAPTGRLRQAQIRWRDMIRRFGGVWVLARSVDDVLEALEEHRATCGEAGGPMRGRSDMDVPVRDTGGKDGRENNIRAGTEQHARPAGDRRGQ